MSIIKKLSIIFIAVMLFGMLPLSAYSSEEAKKSEKFENLSVLGITMENMGVNDSSIPATRSELAYVASKLFDGKDYKNAASTFADVTEDTEFCGYINNANNKGILSGTGDGKFNPDGYVSVDNLYKVLVVIAGYETLATAFGGYPQGYRKAASQLGISGNFSTDANGNITVKGLFEGAEKLLEREYDDFSLTISENGVNLEKSGFEKSVFSQRHNISIYKGIINDINTTPYSASVTLKENVFNSNKVKFALNEQKIFLSNADVNLFEYENAQVKLWVDNDLNEILGVTLDANVEIKFINIAAINSDENPDNSYSSTYINYIKLYDDKKNYRTSDNFEIKYNFEKTTKPVLLTDKIARVVIKDNLITFLESWDLSEGGIISEVTGEHISFIGGEEGTKTIDKINSFEKAIVYKNGISCGLSDLKKESYFDYHISGNKIVIIASEKRISDILYSVSDEEIGIGSGVYKIASNVYVQDSPDTYVKNGRFDYLFNKRITAYFDTLGYCRYVNFYEFEGANELQFLGIIEGSTSDAFNENVTLKVFSLEVESKSMELALSKKCKLSCGRNLNEILAIRDTVNADNVFEFILNDKKEIIEIKNPSMYYGYKDKNGDSSKDATATVTQFNNDSVAYMNVNGKRLYFTGEPITILLKSDKGELYTKTISWLDITTTVTSGVKVRFFGDGGINSNFRLILISGETDTFRVRPDISKQRGIVTEISMVYHNEEQRTQITVVDSGRERKFIISDTDAKLIKSDNVYIEFTTAKFGSADIKLDGTPLSLEDIFKNPPSDWYKETAFKSDSKRLFFDDGRAYFYKSPMIIKRNSENDYEFVSKTSITNGDTVCYRYNTEESRVTFVIVE